MLESRPLRLYAASLEDLLKGVESYEWVYYVDTAISVDGKKRRKYKAHTVFDGEGTFKVRELTELEDACEIYIDSLFLELYDDVLELLRRGIRVYLLKNTRLVKRLREENGLKKSDEVDAKLLSMIPKKRFKQLTAREIGLLKLIRGYERYVKWRETIRQWIRICPLDLLKECAKKTSILSQTVS